MKKAVLACFTVFLAGVIVMAAQADKNANEVTCVLSTKNVVYQATENIKTLVYEATEKSMVLLSITNHSDQPYSASGYGCLAEGFRLRPQSGEALPPSDWVRVLRLTKRTEPKITVQPRSTVTIMYFIDQLAKVNGTTNVVVEWAWDQSSAKPIIIAEPKP